MNLNDSSLQPYDNRINVSMSNSSIPSHIALLSSTARNMDISCNIPSASELQAQGLFSNAHVLQIHQNASLLYLCFPQISTVVQQTTQHATSPRSTFADPSATPPILDSSFITVGSHHKMIQWECDSSFPWSGKRFNHNNPTIFTSTIPLQNKYSNLNKFKNWKKILLLLKSLQLWD